MNFWVPSVLGKKFRASLEIAHLEAGLNINSLSRPHDKSRSLITYCWFKISWEWLWYYVLSVHLICPEIQLPRGRDALVVTCSL